MSTLRRLLLSVPMAIVALVAPANAAGDLEGTYKGVPGNATYFITGVGQDAPVGNCLVDSYDFTFRGIVVQGKGKITVLKCPGSAPTLTAIFGGETFKGSIIDAKTFQMLNVPVFNSRQTITLSKQ